MTRTLRALLLGFVVMASGCATLPPPQDRVASRALSDTDGTRIGRAIAPDVAKDRSKTGIRSLPDPRDAFAARVLLANAAEKSLDAQYYIWSADQAGYLLFEAIWQAAERRVRVRLLLDDLNTKGVDATLATLDAHPNIEVRLYNPLVNRSARALNFLTDFSRLNRRMHNKSFTVDNQVTVLGGRNIANEYFGAGDELTFADLDVLAVGRAVTDVSSQFDVYWNSASAYPASKFVGPSSPTGSVISQPDSPRIAQIPNRWPISRPSDRRRWFAKFSTGRCNSSGRRPSCSTTIRPRHWTPPSEPTCSFSRNCCARSGPAEKRSTSFHRTSYLASTERHCSCLAKRGVAVRVLTNSLAASEAKSVHSGYAKRRRELLAGGVPAL